MQNLINTACGYADDFNKKFDLDKYIYFFFRKPISNSASIYKKETKIGTLEKISHILFDKGDYIDYIKIINDIRPNVLHREFYSNCIALNECQITDMSFAQTKKIHGLKSTIKYLLDLDVRTE